MHLAEKLDPAAGETSALLLHAFFVMIESLAPHLSQCGQIVKLRSENTNLRESITVWLTSCLFCVHAAALHMLN